MTSGLVTVNARKYDGKIRRSWMGSLVSSNDNLVTLLARFSEDVEHNDLGHIRAGTVSVEHFWTDRWYNVFHFREPDGSEKAFYANIAMPATFAADCINYIDLDIDVILWPDGRVDVLDRDDFEENSVKYGYPVDVKNAVERSLDELLLLSTNANSLLTNLAGCAAYSCKH
jgi:protein associated with RNAse G/E